ncbi:MAG: DEAD/DEAH box helicase family protein [Lachnospiraceae bacterium]|nr:DEAD/DEAH box helicase family protein [Lachnospiraceae bacterium]
MITVDINNFYRHQRLYYDELCKRNGQKYHAIISIPTGGGKTKLAVAYAINNLLNNDTKVLWIAHSKYLLNQAYSAFLNELGTNFMFQEAILIHSDASYQHIQNNGKTLNIDVKRINDLKVTHKLIFVTFQSLKSNNNWKNIIGDNVAIIIDEAHHTTAPNFLSIISDYSVNKLTLGLTATPIRMKSIEKYDLGIFYNTDLKVSVNITDLFSQKILVRPIFEEIQYYLNNSQITGINDVTLGLLNQLQNYNEEILSTYKNKENVYKKTVIFAIDKRHVDELYDVFNKEYPGKVFKLYSDLYDREYQFNSFKDSEDGILININILNEGVDIPDINTVFMTKPLESKITVTQIIGRALRKARNKTNANIVNFAVNNIGRKFQIVTPKIAFQYYHASFDPDKKQINNVSILQQSIDIIANLIQNHIQKKATCSLSDVCLAGHYEIVDNDGNDIPIPVTFKEYRKIEKYINTIKNSQKCTFIKKLFFSDDIELIKDYIDESINNNFDILFKKYDDEIFNQYLKVYDIIKHLYNEKEKNNLTKKQITIMLDA